MVKLSTINSSSDFSSTSETSTSSKTSSPKTTDSKSIAERVFGTLCDEIISGKIPAGSKISEPELAKHFNISRSSLREALGKLEACNLVVRRPNIGARVVSLSVDELFEIFAIREALEGMAARLAATQMTDVELDQLQALIDGESTSSTETQPSYLNMNQDFHYAIIKGSKNQRLNRLLCDDLFYLMQMYRHQFGRDSGRASSATREHTLVMDALRDRDPELAELLMRRHIRMSRQHIDQSFNQLSVKTIN